MPRPKEAILSRNLIRDQALAIIDEDGLEALTMRRLADRLNVQAASLYTHFPNKEAVLDAIAERLAKRIDPAGFADSWQAGLRTWANSYYTAIHWHPNAAPVVAAGSRGHAVDQAVAQLIHAGLVGHGWPPRDAVLVATAVKFLVLGAATGTAMAPSQEFDDSSNGRSAARPGARSSAAGSEHLAGTVDGASFTYALDNLIHGLEFTFENRAAKRDRRDSATRGASLTPRKQPTPRVSATRMRRIAGSA